MSVLWSSEQCLVKGCVKESVHELKVDRWTDMGKRACTKFHQSLHALPESLTACWTREDRGDMPFKSTQEPSPFILLCLFLEG